MARNTLLVDQVCEVTRQVARVMSGSGVSVCGQAYALAASALAHAELTATGIRPADAMQIADVLRQAATTFDSSASLEGGH